MTAIDSSAEWLSCNLSLYSIVAARKFSNYTFDVNQIHKTFYRSSRVKIILNTDPPVMPTSERSQMREIFVSISAYDLYPCL